MSSVKNCNIFPLYPMALFQFISASLFFLRRFLPPPPHQAIHLLINHRNKIMLWKVLINYNHGVQFVIYKKQITETRCFETKIRWLWHL